MKIACPTCNEVCNVPDDMIPKGKKASVKCRKCGGEIIVEARAIKIEPGTLASEATFRKETELEAAFETKSVEGKTSAQMVADIYNAFAVDLYQQLGDKEENLFFSPYLIFLVLVMAIEGARGETAEEMGKVLNFPEVIRQGDKDSQNIPWKTSAIHTGIAALSEHLTGQAQSQLSTYELLIANAIWGEKTYPFRDSYIDTISKYYTSAGLFPADFKKNAEAESDRINKWVAEQTSDKIKNIISPGALSSMTRMILANAIYFKGEWSEPFDEANTKERNFFLPGDRKVKMPIMYHSLETGRYAAFNADGSFFDTPREIEFMELAMMVDKWKFLENECFEESEFYPGKEGFAMLELPYKGKGLSMILIAPNAANGLANIEKHLTLEKLNMWIENLNKREVKVFLPKFKLETKYEMEKTLQNMGIVRAFQFEGADFSGMSTSSDPMEQLYISGVLHMALVDVNEKGTEAAAATVTSMHDVGMIPDIVPFPPIFRADRPFLFLIRDRINGSILFMGKVDPGK